MVAKPKIIKSIPESRHAGHGPTAFPPACAHGGRAAATCEPLRRRMHIARRSAKPVARIQGPNFQYKPGAGQQKIVSSIKPKSCGYRQGAWRCATVLIHQESSRPDFTAMQFITQEPGLSRTTIKKPSIQLTSGTDSHLGG